MERVNELFENGCILPCIGEIETPILQRKDLGTLLKELNQIQSRIEEIEAKKECLAKLVALHNGMLPE